MNKLVPHAAEPEVVSKKTNTKKPYQSWMSALRNVNQGVGGDYEATLRYFERTKQPPIADLAAYQEKFGHYERSLQALGHIAVYRIQIKTLMESLHRHWELVLKTTKEIVPADVDERLRQLLASLEGEVTPERLAELNKLLLPKG